MKVNRILWVLYFIFLGIALHDYAHQVWELKGYHNLVEGGYVGFTGQILTLILIFLFRKRKKRLRAPLSKQFDKPPELFSILFGNELYE